MVRGGGGRKEGRERGREEERIVSMLAQDHSYSRYSLLSAPTGVCKCPRHT